MLNEHKMQQIYKLQTKYPGFLLCGSAALIMKDLLPNRDMSDIDFAVNECDVPQYPFLSNLSLDQYGQEQGEDKTYYSHSGYYGKFTNKLKINLLIFKDEIDLKSQLHDVLNLGTIRHQEVDDIIRYKTIYNRPKDNKDLDAILHRAIEKELT